MEIDDYHLWILVFGEAICFLDIVLHFFMSYKEQGSNEYEKDFKKIAMRYLKGKFAFDMFKFLPFGAIGVIYPDYRGFSLLWFIKIMKVSTFLSILD